MKAAALRTFEPRKAPVQKRPTVTVEAIAEATIQVLLAVGLNRLYAVLEAHSIKVVEAVEHACRANRDAVV
jgi:hypothetical protein